MGTITLLLEEIREGRADASDRLFAHIYEDLKIVARKHLRKYRGGIFQATELVNAAYERIASNDIISAADRRQFFYLISRAMHNVLVDQFRSVIAQKRGGGARTVPLIEVQLESSNEAIDLLDLHEALAELGAVDPEAARVVIMRFYAGQTIEEIAESIGSTFSITRRHWEYAKAWLHERLTRERRLHRSQE